MEEITNWKEFFVEAAKANEKAKTRGYYQVRVYLPRNLSELIKFIPLLCESIRVKVHYFLWPPRRQER